MGKREGMDVRKGCFLLALFNHKLSLDSKCFTYLFERKKNEDFF